MTPERDIERILETWMEPGPSTMPDRLFDAVVDRIERVPQRRALRPITRFQAMPNMLKAAGAAAVILLIGVGIGRLQPAAPYAAGDPSPSPLASPTGRPLLLPTAAGPLDPGTYRLGASVGLSGNPFARMTATVPEDWYGIRGSTFANLFQGSDEFFAGSVTLAVPSNFFIDPCDQNAGLLDPPLGPTVDDFVAALANVPGHQTTEATDVTFHGYAGKYVEQIGPPSVAQCTDSVSCAWETQFNETAACAFAGDDHRRLWVLDVDGVTVVITLHDRTSAPLPSGTDPVSVAEQQQVFDSIRIAPAVSPESPSPSPAP
jgi:hypothetical protein